MATDDDDAATLRERVRELEQTVAQQQDTIEQLLPSRRAILAGGAGLVGGAALTGQASAQSAAGQVGTSSEPVDVKAATVTATDVTTDSVNTNKLNNTLSTQSVSNNQIDYVGSFIDISAGDGTNLQTINTPVLGGRVVLTKTSGDNITIENGTGNIFLSSGQDETLGGGNTLELFCADGTNWSEIGSRLI